MKPVLAVSLLWPGLAHLQHEARAVADDDNISSFSWSWATEPLRSIRNIQESGH